MRAALSRLWVVRSGRRSRFTPSPARDPIPHPPPPQHTYWLRANASEWWESSSPLTPAWALPSTKRHAGWVPLACTELEATQASTPRNCGEDGWNPGQEQPILRRSLAPQSARLSFLLPLLPSMHRASSPLLQREGTHSSPRPREPPRLTPSFPSRPCHCAVIHLP